MTTQTARILKTIRRLCRNETGMCHTAMIQALNSDVTHDYLKIILGRLVKSNQIERVERGVYRLITSTK